MLSFFLLLLSYHFFFFIIILPLPVVYRYSLCVNVAYYTFAQPMSYIHYTLYALYCTAAVHCEKTTWIINPYQWKAGLVLVGEHIPTTTKTLVLVIWWWWRYWVLHIAINPQPNNTTSATEHNTHSQVQRKLFFFLFCFFVVLLSQPNTRQCRGNNLIPYALLYFFRYVSNI